MVPKNIKFTFSTFYSFFFKQINIQTQTSYTKLQTIPKYSFFQSYLHVHIKMCHISHKIILSSTSLQRISSIHTDKDSDLMCISYKWRNMWTCNQNKSFKMPWSIQRIILKTPYYPFHQFILDLLRAIASSTALSCLRSSSRREDVLFFSLGALAGGGALGWTLGAGTGWGAALVGDAGAVLAGFFTFLSANE